MELKDLLHIAHHRIEARERMRITQASMAKRIGVSSRTYLEYLRGTNAPIGMLALLKILAQLDDNELTTLVREWQEEASE